MFIRHLNDCKEFTAGDDSILRELLHPDKADLAIRYSLAHATVKPGQKTTPHRLRTAEVYYILRGRGLMHIDEETAETIPGSAIYIPPHATQHIENPGDEDLVFLCMVDPAWRAEDEEILPRERTNSAAEALLAVDVVLLPDDAMTDRAIEFNGQLVEKGPGEIVLNRTDCLPHISLAMGCIEARDVGAIRDVLMRIAGERPVRRLTATRIETPANSQGGTTSLLALERTKALQTLHERVMEEMERFFRRDAGDIRFYDDRVSETTLDWVHNYSRKAGHEQFHPHITLGYGQATPRFTLPIDFSPSRLALCHLGNHATCRKVLAAVDL